MTVSWRLIGALLTCWAVLCQRGANAAPPSSADVDRAVGKAIRFLASQQQASGAWRSGQGESSAVTSLSLMAFMAAGHVPSEGSHGKIMDRGIRFVIDHQHPSGLLVTGNTHGPMYEHGICTLMLAEVAGMVDEPLATRVRTSLSRAVLLILKAQAVSKDARNAGGWRYQPTSNDSDLSATGWQLLALRAAKDVGCDVPAEAIEAAVGYVKKCSAMNRGGGFTYQPGDGVTPTRSGTGILCLEICGAHHAPETLAAADVLRRRPLRYGEDWFFYGVYYCMVGMFQVGGDAWTETRDVLTATLLERQSGDGAWTGQGTNELTHGAAYCTSLSVLALSVEYQYLPIYQR